MSGFGGRRGVGRRLTDSDTLFINISPKVDPSSITIAMSGLVDRPGKVITGIVSYDVITDSTDRPIQIKVNFMQAFGQKEKAATIADLERILSRRLRMVS